MRSRHQFVCAASVVNNCACISVITVQSLVALGIMIFRANYPDNHVIGPIRRGDKRRAATAIVPCGTPAGGDGGRAGGRNAKGRKCGVVVASAKSDIGALVGPIGSSSLDDGAARNLS
jgi:hypothetical protein